MSGEGVKDGEGARAKAAIFCVIALLPGEWCSYRADAIPLLWGLDTYLCMWRGLILPWFLVLALDERDVELLEVNPERGVRAV